MLTTASLIAKPLAAFALPTAEGTAWQSTSEYVQSTSEHVQSTSQYVQSALESVHRAGLVDLDFTVIVQAVLFFTLLLVLPSLVLKPLVARFDQREARTDGARHEAKALRKQADDQVASYELATQEQRKKALLERSETRAATQRQADALVAQARAETQARIDAGLAEQRVAMTKAQAQLDAAAAPLATSIADKLVRG